MSGKHRGGYTLAEKIGWAFLFMVSVVILFIGISTYLS